MAVEHSDKKPPIGFLKWIRWTGFSDKTLWDWMQLLIVPIVLGGGAIWFQGQANSRTEESDAQRAAVQQNIEIDRAQQAAFQSYLSSISTLLLEKNLADIDEETAVREIARANTLSTLRQLDSERKGLLITFLYDSDLIGFTNRPSERDEFGGDSTEESFVTDEPLIIDLDGADLSGANLSEAFLEGVDLLGVNLSKTSLEGVDLSRALLAFANLKGANLQGSVLAGADLSFANLGDSDWTDAIVTNQQLAMAEFLQGLTLPDGSRIDSEEEAMTFKREYGEAE